MNSTLPEDPYHALGLSKDATAAAIKTAYRKLVLKHHPDKVQDESQKQSAADLFHKIQAAWETIGDEDKRSRYDAQCRLISLRKEVAADRSPTSMPRPDMRQAAAAASYRSSDPRPFAPPPRSASYRVEVLRPNSNDADYFEKARSREFDNYQGFDRPRRTSPRGERRSRVTRQDSKEAEKLRQRDKVRQSTKATNRDRDYKNARVESDSEPEYFERSRRSPREVDDEARERERFYAQARRQEEEASSGRYFDQRTQRMFSDAKEYMDRSSTRRQYSDSQRGPSPPRTSSRDHPEVYMKDGRPVAFRRGSGKPRVSSRDDPDAPPRRRRDTDRSSGEYDEPPPRRPPGLSQAKSAPNDIRIPHEKVRASSLQHTREEMADFIPAPVKRADSMPQQLGRSKPTRQSTLRQELSDDEYEPPRRSTQRYPSPGKVKKEYADEYEYPTPNGYVTEPREPSRRTKSPEPIREKNRSSSTRFASQTAPVMPPLSTRTSYQVSSQGNVESLPSRPKLSRGESSRKDSYLYGEVSPRDRNYTTPMPESVSFREIRPDIKMQAGYSTSRRTSEARSPVNYRGSSYNATPPMSAA